MVQVRLNYRVSQKTVIFEIFTYFCRCISYSICSLEQNVRKGPAHEIENFCSTSVKNICKFRKLQFFWDPLYNVVKFINFSNILAGS